MSNRRILFVDRDGCLIEEPADEQIDSYEKLALLPGVIAALQRFVVAGYELVMVTNQDGLGTESFPEAHFTGPHELLMRILSSQGIRFREVLIDRSFPHEGLDTRKPGVGMMRGWLASRSRPLERALGSLDAGEQEAFLKGLRALADALMEESAHGPVRPHHRHPHRRRAHRDRPV